MALTCVIGDVSESVGGSSMIGDAFKAVRFLVPSMEIKFACWPALGTEVLCDCSILAAKVQIVGTGVIATAA